MTRLILAAGVAALAITAPASAKPDTQGGNRAQVAKQERAKRAQRAEPAPVSVAQAKLCASSTPR